MSNKLFIVFVFLSIFPLAAKCEITESDVISTSSANVIGKTDAEVGVTSYLGIPYAQTPVGKLRWAPPKPPIKNRESFEAFSFGHSCMQNDIREMLPWTEEYMFKASMAEDCLTLNIWAPSFESKSTRDNANLPVLVYIHGGAFTSGSGDVPIYNGAQLARQDVIVITINYRLGVFGFFAHEDISQESTNDASGNYGLLDQIEALKWVKTNISSFGGDPENITIGGQSAGAASVHYLVASPLAKGLFQKAIAQSGPWGVSNRSLKLAQMEARGKDYLKNWGLSTQELRALSAAEVQALPIEFQNRFLPNVDGWVLPQDVSQIIKEGKQSDVPMMVGITADENSSQGNYASLSDAKKLQLRNNNLRNLVEWAKFRNSTGQSPTYAYLFSRAQPWEEYPHYGAFHSAELPYMFNNLHLLDKNWEDVDRDLASKMTKLWVAFIKQGVPKADSLPNWGTDMGSYMVFGESLHMETFKN